MNTTRTCPRCGTPLPEDAPEAQCPKCLLDVGMGTQPDAAEATESESSGTPPPSPADLAPHFPQLEILELLGQGGMGIVYKARQPRLERFVALKILPTDASTSGLFADRFSREARTLARLTHPNIVGIYDFGETNGIYYLVMEYVDGANLRELERSGELGPLEALKIVPAICDALQYAHDQGVIHRDIKPENVLIDHQGRVKIADFGLAKILGRPAPELALTRVRQVMGTPNYMAPEQIEHPLEVDHRADIYSLGVVIYEMLTGELPIGHFEPPSQRVQIDARLDQVVLRALAKERDRRYQHVSEVKSDVETIAASPAPAPPPPPDPATARWLQARQAVKGPAMGLVAIGILNWVLVPLYAIIGITFLAHQESQISAATLISALLVMMLCSSFMIFAGLKMKALEAYRVAMIGSVLSILISPGNVIGLPLGIWALVTLTRREVKEAFGLTSDPELADRRRSIAQPIAPPVDRSRRWFFGAATVFVVGCGGLLLVGVLSIVLAMVLPAFHRAKEHVRQKAIAAAMVNAVVVKVFAVGDPTLARDLAVEDGAWYADCAPSRTIQLFEETAPGVEQGVVIYRAQLKAEDVRGRAYLEMWCRFPGKGEFFSRGLADAVTGTTDWTWRETPFLLPAGERPDLIRLNLVVEGAGRVGIREVQLLRAPLSH
ncbi:MAG: serine/threonine protein kinase [Verrucomicrobia bacterium]|nr:serine/threonine protein kinase [Verrucomicrobiota bacterium]